MFKTWPYSAPQLQIHWLKCQSAFRFRLSVLLSMRLSTILPKPLDQFPAMRHDILGLPTRQLYWSHRCDAPQSATARSRWLQREPGTRDVRRRRRAAAADILLTPPPIVTDRRAAAAAAAADRMSASRRRRFRDVFTSCCTPAICCCISVMPFTTKLEH